MKELSSLLHDSLDSLNLSLYFDKYSPIILFPEVIGADKKIISPSGGLIKLSVNLLSPKILEKVREKERSNNLVRFLSKFLDGKERIKPKYTITLPKDVLKCYMEFYEEHKAMLCSLNAEIGKFKTKSKLVVGLGDESIYETSIRLLRNYGVPYIPGSALKGITKHWSIYMLTEWLQENSKDRDFYKLARIVQNSLEDGNLKIFPDKEVHPKDELQKEFFEAFGKERLTLKKMAENLVNIFGTTKYQGTVIFFDALPTPESVENNNQILKLDVITPHYPDYYRKKEAPGDWQNPVPIFFLTVPEGIEFSVGIASRKDLGGLITIKLLTQALREYGVGAKTVLGYGRLERVGR